MDRSGHGGVGLLESGRVEGAGAVPPPTAGRARRRVAVVVGAATVLAGIGAAATVLVGHGGSATGTRIASALSAGPESVSRNATVLDMPARPGDPYVVLRPGTNGWTCFPDYLPTPGPDPACYDAVSLAWFTDVLTGTTPKATGPGISYWLQGSVDASMTDPTLTEPPPGQSWHVDGPHLVVVGPGRIDPKAYPSSGTSVPTVMWPGTPFAHLHVPMP